MLAWLPAIGFRSSIVAQIAAGQYEALPKLAAMQASIAAMQASIAAMQEVLHMRDAQVRRKMWYGVFVMKSWTRLSVSVAVLCACLLQTSIMPQQRQYEQQTAF